MRNTFINEITSQIKNDDNVHFLTGDLGFGVLNNMREVIGARFVNVGVAEQLMTGMAAGLALTGKKVFTYSIANFPTLRCLEQIRNDVCYHNLDVKIVSVGAGVAYGTHGYTHFGVEDITALRSLRNMEVICPADPREAKAAARYILEHQGPTYIRLGKNGEPNIHEGEIDFNKQKYVSSYNLKSDYVFLSTGSIGFEAKLAVESLRGEGVDINFISVPFINSLERSMFSPKLKRVFTLEEHVLKGGFGSAILEFLSDENMNIPVTRFGLPEDISLIGNQKFLLKEYGLISDSLTERIRKVIDAS